MLNNEHISDEQYAHASKVWNTFNLKNMGEYHDLYCRHPSTSRWFWTFQKDMYAILLTRPCYYFTSRRLAWDAMLKITDIKLELITDMFQFIDKGMGGSISYIGNR